ncbi:MAG: hypothetical protein ACMXX7_01215 [Candidatus Woesearchaeota archaeon]
MKKGDLSINIIVVAAIAMVILVIISVLIFRTGSNLTEGTSCAGLSGAQCVSSSISCSEYGQDQVGEVWVPHPTASCPPQETCCIRQGSLFDN